MAASRDTYAYFWVSKFECPDSDITTQMNIAPSRSLNKGAPGISRPQMPFSGWELHSPLPRGDRFIHEHIEALLPLLEPRAQVIRRFLERFEVGISCVGYFTSINPGFHLSKEIISRISKLQLSADFDLYCHHIDSPSSAAS